MKISLVHTYHHLFNERSMELEGKSRGQFKFGDNGIEENTNNSRRRLE